MPAEPHVLSSQQLTSVFPNMMVPIEDRFVPTQMEVKEASSERGHMQARICLVGNNGQTYKVLALPEKAQ